MALTLRFYANIFGTLSTYYAAAWQVGLPVILPHLLWINFPQGVWTWHKLNILPVLSLLWLSYVSY